MHLADGRLRAHGFVQLVPERILLPRRHRERPEGGFESRHVDARIGQRVLGESFRTGERIAPAQEHDARLGFSRELRIEHARQRDSHSLCRDRGASAPPNTGVLAGVLVMTAAATALRSGERWARDVVWMLAELPLHAFLDVAEFTTTRPSPSAALGPFQTCAASGW